ncbi:MAG: HNH endonuclease signature motif containing protein [Nocardioidaceae bacterium]
MTISDQHRKILWGRSGNLCAICKIALVTERTADDPESVVGDEAHIAARSPGGPRYGECDPAKVDTYENLILLCKVDHKIVDDQVWEFTTERLQRTKSEHESWVKIRLQEKAVKLESVRVEVDPSAEPLRLTLLRTGTDVWNVVSQSHAYYFRDLDDDGAEPDQLDQTAEFLQLARDWGEVSSEVNDRGMVAVREAKQSLAEALDELVEQGLLVFGGRRRGILTGGIGPLSHWHDAVIEVVRADSSRIGSSSPPR